MPSSFAHDLVFEVSVTIDAPCEDVFDFLADLRTASAAGGAPLPKMITDPPIGVGTQWMWTRVGRGKTYSEIIAYNRPTVLTRRITGPDMTGVVDESFEPDRGGTNLTRRVNVKGNDRTAASLQSQYLDYLHSIRSNFDRMKQIDRENLQLDRDAQDPTLIAAERAQIKGTLVPLEELSRQIAASMKHRTASMSNSEREFFATKRYSHSRVLGSGPGSSSFLRMLCGPVDMYITCLFGHPDVFYKSLVRGICG